MSSLEATLNITGESITIEAGGRGIVFEPLGGPEEPIRIFNSSGSLDLILSAAQVNELQYSLVNFSNTGYFDQEG